MLPIKRDGTRIMEHYTREGAVRRILDGYRAYYNITTFEGEREPLVAICEFFEHSEKYVLSRQANLWEANCEEFVYLFEMECLTGDVFERCRDMAYEDGLKRANIGPEHMYTYITPIFICDTCEKDAATAVGKCRIYKSFRFSLHGWMDFHVAVLEVSGDDVSEAGRVPLLGASAKGWPDGCKVVTNKSGRCVEGILKNILFPDKGKRRG